MKQLNTFFYIVRNKCILQSNIQLLYSSKLGNTILKYFENTFKIKKMGY